VSQFEQFGYKLKRMRWAGHIASTGEFRDKRKILARKPEGTRPFGKSKHR
jgi:hypothetical protein